MKTSNYIFSFFAILLVSTMCVNAQDSIIDRNVTVEREYKPTIQDAGKINSVPKTLEPTVVKTVPSYTDFNYPLEANNNIHTLSAAELQLAKRELADGGFARVGLGNYVNTLADFAFPLIRNSDVRLDFSFNHLGTFSDKAHSTTKTALSFDKYFSNFNFYAGIGAGHEYLKFYGNNFNRNGKAVAFDTLATKYGGNSTYLEENMELISRLPQTVNLNSLANDSLSNTFWRYNAFAGIRSLPMTTGLRYMAEANYNVFSSRNGLTEHLLNTKAGFNAVHDDYRLGLDLEMYNLNYISDNNSLQNFWSAYTVFTMNPYYGFERETWNVRLGVKSSFSFVHGQPFNPSADVSAEWKAIPKYLSFYGGLTGGYNVNTMDNMAKENRYLFSDVRVKDTYTPFDFYLGIKIKPLYNLLLDGYIDYKRIDNQYFFMNKEYAFKNSTKIIQGADSVLYSNRFNVLYSDATLFKIGLRANYNLQNKLNIQLKGAYNKWDVTDQEYAWNKPNWEADLSTTVQITRDFSVNGNVYFEGDRYAKLGNNAVKMNQKIDVNLGASYSYNNWFTAFAKLNNVLNSSYQEYYGYEVQGLNVMAGAAFSF